MRAIFNHLAWALATVALVIATPMQAAAYDTGRTTTSVMGTASVTSTARPNATPNTSSPAAARAAISSAFATAAEPQQDTGQGWAELYCMACVGLGALALHSGGIAMLPVILGNPSVYGTFTGTCLLACQSAIKSLLK